LDIRVEKNPTRGLEAIMTSDDGQVLVWPMTAMSRNIRSHDLVFKEVNAYWAAVSDTRRKQIFKVYADIHEHIEEVLDISALQKALVGLVNKLYELHPKTNWRLLCLGATSPTPSR